MPVGEPGSEVTISAYVAKQCPARAQFRHHPDTRDLPLPEPGPVQQMIIDDGVEFERHVVEMIRTEYEPGRVRFVDELDGADEAGWVRQRDEVIAATVRAMEDGVELIVGGWLPSVGRRSGRPDLLVRHPDGGYVPADIKHHRTQDAAAGEGKRHPARVSALTGPWERVDSEVMDLKTKADDAFQLAHYWRMLEDLKFAAKIAAPVGAIVGKELAFVWYDLGADLWQTRSTSQLVDPDEPDGDHKVTRKIRSTLDRYDHELDFRLKVIDAAALGGDCTVEPVKIAECANCPWWTVICQAHLEGLDDGAGHVSVLPGVGWDEARRHRAAGVRSCRDLADLDLRTAVLLSGRSPGRTGKVTVDPDLLRPKNGPDPQAPVSDTWARKAPRRQALFASQGIETVGDLTLLDQHTIDRYTRPERTGLAAQPVPVGLADLVVLARAKLGPSTVYRRTDPAGVPRADIEIDIDMESDLAGGVYLWGAIATDRTDPTKPVTGDYTPFVTWEHPLPENAEGALLAEFWQWLTGWLHPGDEHGEVKIYCWNEQAEASRIRAIAGRCHGNVEGVPSLDEVDAIIRSERWVDLMKATQRLTISPSGYGLKTIAPLAAFEWKAEDAGGDASVVWYRDAVKPDTSPQREALRQKLLTYNEDDVRATLATREWLDSNDFQNLPSAANLLEWP